MFRTIFKDICSSTMDEAKIFAKEQRCDDIVCLVAQTQTAGRGRGGSTWVQAPPQAETQQTPHTPMSLEQAFSLCGDVPPLTLIIPPERLKIPLEWLSIAVGCALYDTFEKTRQFLMTHFFDLPFSYQTEERVFYVKWPNDIIALTAPKEGQKVQGVAAQKISGILCETTTNHGSVQDIFVGIGINFFAHPGIPQSSSFWETILTTVDKRHKAVQAFWSRKESVACVLSFFAQTLCQEIAEYVCQMRQPEQLRHLALQRSVPKGTLLSVQKGLMQGQFLNLTLDGALVLEGIHDPIYTGDVSIPDHVTSFAALVMDFGNTHLHMACRNHLGVIHYVDVDYALFSNPTALKSCLQQVLECLAIQRKDKIPLLYASVLKPEDVQRYLEELTVFFRRLLPDMKLCPQRVKEDDIIAHADLKGNVVAEHMGTDRALKFYFASMQAKKLKKNVVVFSFGTAFTCEGVSADGVLIENFVAPGIRMAFDTLHQKTALLPALKPDASRVIAGKQPWNQEVYLQRGVFLSVLGPIFTIAKLHGPCQCYFTGGNRDDVARLIQEMSPLLNQALDFEVISHLEMRVILDLSADLFVPEKHPLALLPHAEPTPIKRKVAEPKKPARLKKIPQEEEPQEPLLLDDFTRIGVRIEHGAEQRLDKHMAALYPFYTRDQWREKIRCKEVVVEQRAPQQVDYQKKPLLITVKPTYKTKKYDQIWIFRPPHYETEPTEPIHVVSDDGDVCVFSKPPHLVVHTVGLHIRHTFIRHIGEMGYEGCYPVHRIDKETSGLLICARQPATRKILSEAFSRSQVKKMYLAVTKGPPISESVFTVDAPIGEAENSQIRLKLWVHGRNPQNAMTRFVKLASSEGFHLFACFPLTGRTNQIRVHLASIGQWIVGDKMYHQDERVFLEFFEHGLTQWVQEQVLFPRHLLHNAGILFEAGLGAEMGLETLAGKPVFCPIPEDMAAFCQSYKLFDNLPYQTNPKAQNALLQNLFEQNCVN